MVVRQIEAMIPTMETAAGVAGKVVLFILPPIFILALIIGVVKSINDTVLKLPGTSFLWEGGAPLLDYNFPIIGRVKIGADIENIKQNPDDWLFRN